MPFRPEPDVLVARIAGLQSTGSAPFPEGLFPAWRTHRTLPYRVPDDSVFFTAVTVYTMHGLCGALSEASRRTVDAVAARAVATYPRYLNNEGWPMYNFWQTTPEDRFFPNGRLLSHFRHFRLPEDVDTTAYIYLTQPHSPEDAARLKDRLVLDTNGHRRSIRSTLPRYRHLPAYTTWLAQENMPLDFDVCALANLMLMIHAYALPQNAHDAATIHFITEVIRHGDHLRHPFRVAPWYADPALILYHVARLVACTDYDGLAAIRPRLATDARRLAETAPTVFHRILCSTALLRLGEPAALDAYPDDLDDQLGRFHFFVGSLLTAVDHPVARWLAPWEGLRLRYHCPAHTLALLLEHEVLRTTR